MVLAGQNSQFLHFFPDINHCDISHLSRRPQFTFLSQDFLPSGFNPMFAMAKIIYNMAIFNQS
jgi:hypothetical protein